MQNHLRNKNQTLTMNVRPFFYSPLCGCLSLMRCFVCCALFVWLMMMMFSSLCNSPLTISFSTLTLLMSAPLMKNKNAQAAYRFSRPRRRNQVRASSACLCRHLRPVFTSSPFFTHRTPTVSADRVELPYCLEWWQATPLCSALDYTSSLPPWARRMAVARRLMGHGVGQGYVGPRRDLTHITTATYIATYTRLDSLLSFCVGRNYVMHY